ncbi:hypothetical protein ACGFX4_38765 [Kitasatospora sp. NPDC048365]|uniref:hypothetical protein n=1 Tax=Kitasatospora sp. NPDC048365 TaxID=3364050 RepID=UPI003715302A
MNRIIQRVVKAIALTLAMLGLAVLGTAVTALPAAATTVPDVFVGATKVGGDTLQMNQTLYGGQYIQSNSGQFALLMQGDGNLVEYGPESNGWGGPRAVWSSGTWGQSGNRVVMQGDGNLVIYKPNNSAAWSSRTYNSGAVFLRLQDDGRIVLQRSDGLVAWQTGTWAHLASAYPFGSYQLRSGQQLNANQYLANDRYRLFLQADTNLILYGPGFHILWQSGNHAFNPGRICGGASNVRMVVNSQGSLELRAVYNPQATDSSGRVVCLSAIDQVWFSTPAAGAGSFAPLQTDGNFVLYTSGGSPVWATGTNGRV